MRSFILSCALIALIAPIVAGAAEETKGKRIKKCQDAAGKWHYGDSADAACAKSKVTEISDKGTKKKEIAAPLTEAELRDRELRKDEIEQERKRAEARARRDDLLLSTYGHEDDIAYTRDRKLAQLDASIRASEDTLKTLRGVLSRLEAQGGEETRGGKAMPEQSAKSIAQTQRQIATHENIIATKRKEQEAVRQQAAADLARYRELKQGPAKKDNKNK